MKLLIDLKVPWLSSPQRGLLQECAERLTPAAYRFVQYTTEGGQADRAQLTRLSRTVPLLVEKVEQVDLHVVTLAKQCSKHEDLGVLIKRSAVRDFRIDGSKYDEVVRRAEELAEERKR